MKKQTSRLHFNIALQASRLQRRLFPMPLKEIPELEEAEAEKLEELLDQEHEEYIRSEPVLIPRNTMLLGDNGPQIRCNFLTANRYRTAIHQVYEWAIAHNINVFIVDYTTPVGLLAMETLLDLRSSGEQFNLYAVKSKRISRRKSYRLIRETEIKLIWSINKCDYHYLGIYMPGLLKKIRSNVGNVIKLSAGMLFPALNCFYVIKN